MLTFEIPNRNKLKNKAMTTKNLENKLNKMGVNFKIVQYNEFNSDYVFMINGKTYQAGFNVRDNKITDYCRAIGYCQSSQETQRIFFKNFNKVLDNAN
jgi:hypothetical protein